MSSKSLFAELQKLSYSEVDQNELQHLNKLSHRIEELLTIKFDLDLLQKMLEAAKYGNQGESSEENSNIKRKQRPNTESNCRLNSLRGDEESPNELDDEEEGRPGKFPVNLNRIKATSGSEIAYSSQQNQKVSDKSIVVSELASKEDEQKYARRKSGNSHAVKKATGSQVLPPLSNPGIIKQQSEMYQTFQRKQPCHTHLEAVSVPIITRKSSSFMKNSRHNLIKDNIFSYEKDGSNTQLNLDNAGFNKLKQTGAVSRQSLVSLMGRSDRAGARTPHAIKQHFDSPFKEAVVSADKKEAEGSIVAHARNELPIFSHTLTASHAAQDLLVDFFEYLAKTAQSLKNCDCLKRALLKAIFIARNLDKFKISADDGQQAKSRAKLLNRLFKAFCGIVDNERLDEELRNEVLKHMADDRSNCSFTHYIRLAIRDQLPSADTELGLITTQTVMCSLKVAAKLPDQVRVNLIDELITKFTFYAKPKVKKEYADDQQEVEKEQKRELPSKKTLDLVRIFKAPNKHILLILLTHLLSREDFQSLRRSSPKYIAEKQSSGGIATPVVGSQSGRLLISDRQVGDIMSVCLKAVGLYLSGQKGFANLVIYLKLAFRIFACVGADGAQSILGQRTLPEFIMYFLMKALETRTIKRPVIERSQFATFLEMCNEAMIIVLKNVRLLEQLAMTATSVDEAQSLQKRAQQDRLVFQQVLDTITLFSWQLGEQNPKLYNMLSGQLTESVQGQPLPPRAGTVVNKPGEFAPPKMERIASAKAAIETARLNVDNLYRTVKEQNLEPIIVSMVCKLMRLEQLSLLKLTQYRQNLVNPNNAIVNQLTTVPLISLRYLSNIVQYVHNESFEVEEGFTQNSNQSFLPGHSLSIEEKLHMSAAKDKTIVQNTELSGWPRFQSVMQLVLYLHKAYMRFNRGIKVENEEMNAVIDRQLTQDFNLIQLKLFQSASLLRGGNEIQNPTTTSFAIQLNSSVQQESEQRAADQSECQFASLLYAFSSIVLKDFAQFLARDPLEQMQMSEKAQLFVTEHLNGLVLEPISKILRRVHFMTMLPMCLKTLTELVCMRSSKDPVQIGSKSAQAQLLDFGLEMMTFQQNEANQELLRNYLVSKKQHDTFEEKRQFALLLDCLHTLMHSQFDERSSLNDNSQAIQLWTQIMIFVHRRRENANFIRPQLARLAAITPCIVHDHDLAIRSKSVHHLLGDLEDFVKERQSLLQRYPQLLQSFRQQLDLRRLENQAAPGQSNNEMQSPSKSEFIKKIANARQAADETRKNQKNQPIEEDKDNQDGLEGPEMNRLEDSELAKHMLNSSELTFLQMFLTITESRLFFFKSLMDKKAAQQRSVANKTLRPFNFFESMLAVLNVSHAKGSEANLQQQLDYVAKIAIQEYIVTLSGMQRSRLIHKKHHSSDFVKKIIEHDLMFILKGRMHTNLIVSRVAAFSLKKFVDHMPMILNQFSVFQLLHDSLDIVAESLQDEYTSISSAVELPTIGDLVFLPSEHERRKLIMQQLKTIYMDLYVVSRLIDTQQLMSNQRRYRDLLTSKKKSSKISLILYEKLQATFTTDKILAPGASNINYQELLELAMNDPKQVLDEVQRLKTNLGPTVFFQTDDFFDLSPAIGFNSSFNDFSPQPFPIRVPMMEENVTGHTGVNSREGKQQLLQRAIRYLEKIQLTRQLIYLQKHQPIEAILLELSHERMFLREQVLRAKQYELPHSEEQSLTQLEQQRTWLFNTVQRILGVLDKQSFIQKQIQKLEPIVNELFGRNDDLMQDTVIRQLISAMEPGLLKLLHRQLNKLRLNGQLSRFKNAWYSIKENLWVLSARLSLNKKSLNSRARVIQESELTDSLRESIEKSSQDDLLTNFFQQLYHSDHRQSNRPKVNVPMNVFKQADSVDQQVHATICVEYLELFTEMTSSYFRFGVAEEPRINDIISETFDRFTQMVACPLLSKLTHKNGFMIAALKTVRTLLQIAHHQKMGSSPMAKSLLQSALAILMKLICKQDVLKYGLASPHVLNEHMQLLKDVSYLLPKVNSRSRSEEFIATLNKPIDESQFHEVKGGTHYLINLETYHKLGARRSFARVISIHKNMVLLRIKDSYRRRVFFPVANQQQLHVVGGGSGLQDQATFFNSIILDQLSQVKCSLMANNYSDRRMMNMIAPTSLRVPHQQILDKIDLILFSYPLLLLKVLKQQSIASLESLVDQLTKQYMQAVSQGNNSRSTSSIKTIDKLFWKTPDVLEILMRQASDNKFSLNSHYRKLLVMSRNRSLSRMIVFLGFKYSGLHYLHAIALKPFFACPSEVAIFYFSQIFQSLRWDTRNQLTHWLVKRSRELPSIAHNVIWFCRVEKFVDAQPQRKVPLPVDEKLDDESKRVEEIVFSNMTKTERDYFDTETEFLERITSISGVLKPAQSKDEKKAIIREKLIQYNKDIPDNVYLPTNQRCRVVGIVTTSGMPMQSAARVPIKVDFEVQDYCGPDSDPQLNRGAMLNLDKADDSVLQPKQQHEMLVAKLKERSEAMLKDCSISSSAQLQSADLQDLYQELSQMQLTNFPQDIQAVIIEVISSDINLREYAAQLDELAKMVELETKSRARIATQDLLEERPRKRDLAKDRIAFMSSQPALKIKMSQYLFQTRPSILPDSLPFMNKVGMNSALQGALAPADMDGRGDRFLLPVRNAGYHRRGSSIASIMSQSGALRAVDEPALTESHLEETLLPSAAKKQSPTKLSTQAPQLWRKLGRNALQNINMPPGLGFSLLPPPSPAGQAQLSSKRGMLFPTDGPGVRSSRRTLQAQVQFSAFKPSILKHTRRLSESGQSLIPATQAQQPSLDEFTFKGQQSELESSATQLRRTSLMAQDNGTSGVSSRLPGSIGLFMQFESKFKAKLSQAIGLAAGSAQPQQLAQRANDDVESEDGANDGPRRDPNKPVRIVSCIFKVNDDLRQDILAIQFIKLFQKIFQKNELDLFVAPYKCISNRTGSEQLLGGIIEVVPNSSSRDQIGKAFEIDLHEYFLKKYGSETSLAFQKARQNFIRSLAAYSVVSYILQIKDRHNGNILVDEAGHLIHIDFGFIFDWSPGRDMRFESANFKLTKEFVKILGGSDQAEAYQLYVQRTIQGYLAVRAHYREFMNLVELMIYSGFPCFKPISLQTLQQRFRMEGDYACQNQFEAATHMRSVIRDAHEKWTTIAYDMIQYKQNRIVY